MVHREEALPNSHHPVGIKESERLPILPVGATVWPWLCQGKNVSVYYTSLKPTCWPEHRHEQTELLLTFDGASAEITWEERSGQIAKCSLGAHQFCLIPPNVPHSCEWKSKADIVAIYIEERLLREHINGPFHSVIIDDFQALTYADAFLWSIGGMFRSLCHIAAIQPASFIEGMGTALAARTLEQHFNGDHPGVITLPKLPGASLLRMVTYIQANMHDAISVADLAKDAALSVDHFARLVKNTTGWSPLQFLLKCRVEKALELLRTGEFRVAEAAYEVGFCDQSHLDRHCRKFFGVSPKSAMKVFLDVGSSL